MQCLCQAGKTDIKHHSKPFSHPILFSLSRFPLKCHRALREEEEYCVVTDPFALDRRENRDANGDMTKDSFNYGGCTFWERGRGRDIRKRILEQLGRLFLSNVKTEFMQFWNVHILM